MNPHHRLRRAALFVLAIIAAAAYAGCGGPETSLDVAPAIDRMARGFLRTLASKDMDSIRLRLSPEGKERVTSSSLARTFACFEAGEPIDVALVDLQIADRRTPATPAERHRLTYRLLFNNEQKYYYFFELMIEAGDSTITGFRIEPNEKPGGGADTVWPG
jgi:hypothetical protein